MNKTLILILFLLIGTVVFAAYSSYSSSPDGSDVACGGEYSSYSTSPDGSSVCAGGRYSSYATSPDRPVVVEDTPPVALHPVQGGQRKLRGEAVPPRV